MVCRASSAAGRCSTGRLLQRIIKLRETNLKLSETIYLSGGGRANDQTHNHSSCFVSKSRPVLSWVTLDQVTASVGSPFVNCLCLLFPQNSIETCLLLSPGELIFINYREIMKSHWLLCSRQKFRPMGMVVKFANCNVSSGKSRLVRWKKKESLTSEMASLNPQASWIEMLIQH